MELYKKWNSEYTDKDGNIYAIVKVEDSHKKLKKYLTSIGKTWADTLIVDLNGYNISIPNIASFNINDKDEMMKFIDIPVKLNSNRRLSTYESLKSNIFNSKYHDILYEGMKKHPELFYPSIILKCDKFSENELEYLLMNSKMFSSKTRILGSNSTNRSVNVNAILKYQDISLSFLKKIFERYADDEDFQGDIIKTALSKKVLEHQLYTENDLVSLILKYEVSK